MLHILLLVIKIIFIILAVLIGLILSAAVLLLFVPVRYRADVQYYDDRQSASFKISWLLRLISVVCRYDRENGTGITVKLTGIRIKKKDGNRKKTDRRTEVSESDSVFKEDGQDSEQTSSSDIKHIKHDDMPDSEKEPEGKSEPKKISFSEKIKKIYNKALNLKNNTKEAADKLSAAVNNEDYRVLFRFLKQQLAKLIKIIKPKKGRFYVRYGFEDIETTGKVTAFVAVLYGFLGIDVDICPDFERKIFECETYVKGRIRLSGILVICVRCLLNKEFRKYILKRS